MFRNEELRDAGWGVHTGSRGVGPPGATEEAPAFGGEVTPVLAIGYQPREAAALNRVGAWPVARDKQPAPALTSSVSNPPQEAVCT